MDADIGGGDKRRLTTPLCNCERGFNRRTHVYESHRYDPEACYADPDDLEESDD